MAAMHTGTAEEDAGKFKLSSIDDWIHGPALWFHLSSRHDVGRKVFLQTTTDRGRGEGIIMIRLPHLWIGYAYEGVANTKNGSGPKRSSRVIVILIQQGSKRLRGTVSLGAVCRWGYSSNFVGEECLGNRLGCEVGL